MASRIKILPEVLANKIAAGEVVERPASVVKELVENALDAAATRIVVDVQAGGGRLISVSDDGSGMGTDDALLAFERHATSKIAADSDLFAINTLGFRGEALPSIASVSRMRLTTSTGDGSPGSLIVMEGGRLMLVKEVGAPRGTLVEVRDLFYNTPARLKFLKSRETEFSHIAAAVEKTSLANPGVHFRLTHDGREILDCPPVRRLMDRVAEVYGPDFTKGLVEISYPGDGCRVRGVVSMPGVSYSDKSRQECFVNGRPVKSPVISRAVYDAYQSLIMKERHPACILFLDMEPELVDVNVHPAKREVRFLDNQAVHRAIYDAVSGALRAADAGEGMAAAAPGEGWKDRVRESIAEYVSTTDEVGAQKDRYRYFTPRGDFTPVQERMKLPQGPGVKRAVPEGPETGHESSHYQAYPLQAADSYIIIPDQDGYMVIDQHAAHERVQYEKVKARHMNQSGSQGLLVPERLELSAKEASLMEGILVELGELGIEVERFGGGSFLIRSKPFFLDKVDIKEVVLGILADMDESDIKGRVEDMREKVYQLIACKSAVKAGQRLHPEAMKRLVAQLFECEMPYTCAHGRPTVIKFGLSELEKMFKRK